MPRLTPAAIGGFSRDLAPRCVGGACRDEAIEIAGDSIYRTWRLYLTSSAREVDRGSINLQQSLLSRPVAGRHTAPLTREDLYA